MLPEDDSAPSLFTDISVYLHLNAPGYSVSLNMRAQVDNSANILHYMRMSIQIGSQVITQILPILAFEKGLILRFGNIVRIAYRILIVFRVHQLP